MSMAEKVGSGMQLLPEQVDTTREDLHAEFDRDPFAAHPRELALVLGAMRSDAELPRLVLIRTGPSRWIVAAARRPRGAGLALVSDRVFTDLGDAERFAFDQRWQWLKERGDHD
jgi:hypothetical protein